MKSFQVALLIFGFASTAKGQVYVEVGGQVLGPPPNELRVTSASVRVCSPHDASRGCDPKKDSDSLKSKDVDRFSAEYKFLNIHSGRYDFVAVDNSGLYLPGCKTVTVPNQTKVDIELQEADEVGPVESTLVDENKHPLAFRRVRVVPRCFDWENRSGFVVTDAQGKFKIPALALAKDHQSVIQIDAAVESSGHRPGIGNGSYWNGGRGIPRLVNVAFQSPTTSQETTGGAEEKDKQSGVIQGQSVIGKPQSIPLLPPNEAIMPRRWTVNLEKGTVAADNGLTVTEKVVLHLRRFYDPSSLFLPGVVATINQARGIPVEWRQGAGGLGRRYASAYGYSIAVRNVLNFAIDAPMHLDPRYFPSERRGPWPRLKHAFAQTVVTQKDDGGRTFNYWRVGSAYGGGFISNLWYPKRIAGPDDAALRGTTALGLDTAADVIREFSPDMLRVTKHLFRHRQRR